MTAYWVVRSVLIAGVALVIVLQVIYGKKTLPNTPSRLDEMKESGAAFFWTWGILAINAFLFIAAILTSIFERHPARLAWTIILCAAIVVLAVTSRTMHKRGRNGSET